MSIMSTKIYAEYSANAVLVLLAVACALLDRQVKTLAEAFEDGPVLPAHIFLWT